MNMNHIFDKAIDWTHRRRYIKHLLWFLCAMLTVNIGGSIALAFFAKFSPAVSTFFIVFCICNFMTLLGIIGSYIFRASWDTKNFLEVLPNIIPKLGGGNKDDGDDNGLSLEDMLKRDRD